MFKKILLTLSLTMILYSDVDIPDNKCALIIASSDSMSEIKEYLSDNLDDKRFLNVYVANNQKYAISRGFLTDDEVDIIMKKWKISGKIPQDSFCAKSSKFIRELAESEYTNFDTSNKYNYSSKSTSTSTPSGCKDLAQEKATCYALSFGPKACSEAIFQNEPELRETLSSRIGVSTACTYSVKKSLASEYVPDDFALTVLDEITEPSCKKLIDGDANFFETIFGISACVTVAGSTALKLDMAKNCVRKIEDRCN